MVARGLVTKRVDPDDGRGALVQATELGAEAFRAIARRHGATIAARMAVLTPDEQRQLRAITSKLRGVDTSHQH